MPFLTDVNTPGTPSWTPAPSYVQRNLIVADNGGSQAVDNDDGSSWWTIRDNFFFRSDGLKMDYG